MFFSGMGGPGRSRSGPVDTKLYDVLQVSPTASDDEIKKSYRKLAREFHPDKNKDHGDKFKEISFAYEILSNAEKRQMYDARGLDGIKEGGAGGGFEDIFSMFGGNDDHGFGGFGGLFGGMGGGRSNRRRKYQETVHPLNISLEEAYKGKISKLKISKKGLCEPCKGTGTKSGQSAECRTCRGRGVRTQTRQVRPGMIQQMQVPCSDCSGKGDKIAHSDRCPECMGAKSVEKAKTHEIPIPPGAQHDQRICLAGEGNQADPSIEAGDLMIVIQIKDHEIFKREGDDLLMTKEISLNEALCGYEIGITHLDGRKMILSGKPGEVVMPGSTLGVVGEGMPVYRHPELKGNLLVTFSVRFPEDHFFADDKKYAILKSLFAPAKQVPTPADAEEVYLMDFDENKYGRGRGGHAYGEDEEDVNEMGGHSHGGSRVQCAQS